MQKMNVKTIKWNSPCVCGLTTVVVCCGAAIALVSGLVWGTAVGVKACAGGRSYFCNCNRYASAVGTLPQHTSNVLVLALTSWTREGAGGFSVNNNYVSMLALTELAMELEAFMIKIRSNCLLTLFIKLLFLYQAMTIQLISYATYLTLIIAFYMKDVKITTVNRCL